MIRKTLAGLLSDENLMKNVFSGIGYLVFSAGFARLVLSNLSTDDTKEIVAVASFVFILIILSFLFWVIHVIRPLVRFTWPEFGIPWIDKDAQKVVPWWAVFKRVDIIFYLIAVLLSLQGGSYLVKALLNAQ